MQPLRSVGLCLRLTYHIPRSDLIYPFPFQTNRAYVPKTCFMARSFHTRVLCSYFKELLEKHVVFKLLSYPARTVSLILDIDHVCFTEPSLIEYGTPVGAC